MSANHERLVLGAMLTSSAAIDDVSELLRGEHFADPKHERVFDAIQALVADGKPVDPISVSDALGDGKASELFGLASAAPLPASAGYHAEKVRDSHRVRKVHEVGARLAALEGYDPLEVVNSARAELDALLDEDATDESHETAVYNAMASLERSIGVPTAWRRITDTLGGWAPGSLYVIGARPGVGKTVMGIGCLLDIGRRGSLGVMFSLEMPKNELYLRMVSAVGTVSGERMLHRATNRDEDDRLAKAAAHVSLLPLAVDDRSNVSLAQIRARVRSEQRKREVGLVIVDYLGLVKPPADAPRNDRRVQVDLIAQGLKNLARDLKVPVVALAQLNRGIEGRADKAPNLSDLRESGGIEAAADVVILMHRATSDLHGDPTDLQITFAKNRQGPQASAHLVFEGQFSRAVDPFDAHVTERQSA